MTVREASDLTAGLLERAKQTVDEPVGTAGTSVPFQVGNRLSIIWQLRLVSDTGEPIEGVPYSLCFASTCCIKMVCFRYSDRQDKDLAVCSACETPQPWFTGMPNVMSLLSEDGLKTSLNFLAKAIEYFWLDINPLTAHLMAVDLVNDLARVSNELYEDGQWRETMLAKIAEKREELNND